MDIILLGLLLSFLAGLIIGKQTGYTRGYQQGISEAPLILREKSLQENHCLLCQEIIKASQEELQVSKRPV